ncbi:MAG: aminoacetone oxidase family FAD-binding enzyme [Candidatus Kerfeldbacteria bacterium CG08_land_8_20_14_0_20_42_7]|uniref:Aminoacetone oxidase family FAD-binding enzyme n=1 Tax=Candidatus Kerfeldbacteria bacterium CG08_land_8_20_14_0_20_42_7 TaxID=2014245 RepID=A0A2H0YSA6_9BACT|nr:MAG: aminoacetone oxidase family FAD-binding enzyme [Candidatus Kerfeldbacteria bacterium CG08_land_8_20_14_0_20_42_7]
MERTYDVIVIGGGASGMMAAGRAAERGLRVLLLEKNKTLGVKLAMTGGGRCNICNAEDDIHQLLANYGTAKRFLYSSFSQFGVAETFSFFKKFKIFIKVEELKRAFPVTERAQDVVQALKIYLQKGKVEIKTNLTVSGFVTKEEKILGIRSGGHTYAAQSYILATGGKSHQETGSTGDGFRWLSSLHHNVQNPTPSVVPLAVRETWVKSLAGVTLDEVKITFLVDQNKMFTAKGRILCTHFGLSGPLILNSSKKVSDLLAEGSVTAVIDIFPQYDEGELDAHVTKTFEQNKNRSLKNTMRLLTPKGASAVILGLLFGLDPEKKIHSVTKVERKKIVNLLKGLPISISGLMGYERAVVVDGGLDLSEVDGKTMRSRRCKNLFITGDLLNINRPSGGFSLQLCWTTGWVAGGNA